MTWDGPNDRRGAPRAADHRVSMAKGLGRRHIDEHVERPMPLLLDVPLRHPPTRWTTRLLFRLVVAGIFLAVILSAGAAWSVNARLSDLEHERQQRRTDVDRRIEQLQRDLVAQREESLQRLCSVLASARAMDRLADRAYGVYCTRD